MGGRGVLLVPLSCDIIIMIIITIYSIIYLFFYSHTMTTTLPYAVTSVSPFRINVSICDIAKKCHKTQQNRSKTNNPNVTFQHHFYTHTPPIQSNFNGNACNLWHSNVTFYFLIILYHSPLGNLFVWLPLTHTIWGNTSSFLRNLLNTSSLKRPSPEILGMLQHQISLPPLP